MFTYRVHSWRGGQRRGCVLDTRYANHYAFRSGSGTDCCIEANLVPLRPVRTSREPQFLTSNLLSTSSPSPLGQHTVQLPHKLQLSLVAAPRALDRVPPNGDPVVHRQPKG